MSLLGLGKIRRRRGRHKAPTTLNNNDNSNTNGSGDVGVAVGGADAVSIPSSSSSSRSSLRLQRTIPMLKSCLKKEENDTPTASADSDHSMKESFGDERRQVKEAGRSAYSSSSSASASVSAPPPPHVPPIQHPPRSSSSAGSAAAASASSSTSTSTSSSASGSGSGSHSSSIHAPSKDGGGGAHHEQNHHQQQHHDKNLNHYRHSPNCSPNNSHASRNSSSRGSNSNSSGVAHSSSTDHHRNSTRGRSTRSNVSAVDRSSNKNNRPKVRFQSVEIREFSRTVSDNPSCSSGPPIGISWDHSEPRLHNINVFEHHRGYERKRQLDMVLSRGEREKLLLEWGVPYQQIAEGTRSALRVKNQRRQTIVNSGKVAKLEETFEDASRRLKNAFSIGRSRSQEDKLNHMTSLTSNQQHPETSARQPPLSLSPSKDEIRRSSDDSIISGSSQTRCSAGNGSVETVEPDNDIFEKLDMKVDISNVVSNSPTHAMMMVKSVSRLSSDDDGTASIDGYTLGATTLGNNSTTPSQMEMERFYQELELECFGEPNDIPSMVGQTLEVPAPVVVRQISDTSASDENDGFDNDDNLTSMNDSLSDADTFSSNPQSASFSKQSWKKDMPTRTEMTSDERPKQTEGQVDQVHDVQYNNAYYGVTSSEYHSAQDDSRNQYHWGVSTDHHSWVPQYGQNYLYPPSHNAPVFDEKANSSKLYGGPPSRARQNSLDSFDIRTQQQNCNEDIPSRRQHEIDQALLVIECMKAQEHEREVDDTWVSSRLSSLDDDGPQIRHMPLSNYMSPTRWMEDHDTLPFYFNSTVTIMEDHSE
eukprot:CAMPEP_0113474956 /NCGR_PEP_ID=MMETSP0014_2-20120614/18862_1 /TAXON_ID=2857 /ORGANISM="Nitzschia sp." /LENGTH=814 /DNA_ID=CAMNT_0000367841 /DNA_START=231 /DNA_END=2675 /DNA_ORIENTATION=- /assembly_acc=CAM_ASM_000159